jgi:membrane protease subunit HflC
MRVLIALILIAATAVGTLWAAEFNKGPVVITKENEFKIIQFFGDPVKMHLEPGLGWRIPILTEVTSFDKRLQYLNAVPVELQIAGSEKLIVDYYALWKIVDPLAFLKAFPHYKDGQAENRIKRSINSGVKAQVAQLSKAHLLSRAEILSRLSETTGAELKHDGVAIVDVRINRTELPRDAEPAAFAQMREQRRAVSRDHRAVGERLAREIRAVADREARTKIAQASSESQVTQGEGDAEAAAIYAAAYRKAPEFYAFLRSLEAYRKTLGDRTVMVLSPDHEFFQFLQPSQAISDMGAALQPPQTAPEPTAAALATQE